MISHESCSLYGQTVSGAGYWIPGYLVMVAIAAFFNTFYTVFSIQYHIQYHIQMQRYHTVLYIKNVLAKKRDI